jgi:predicted outer membrane repeat protein
MNVSGSSEPTIRDCVFQDNVAPSAGGPSSKGGAICCDLATIDRCTFLNNRAFGQGDGGAVACGAAQITDCVFEGNRVGGDPDAGGGAIVSAGATIQRCTFRNNSAGGFMVAVGGAVWEYAGGSITSCVFDGNTVTAADLGCSGGAVSVRGAVSDCVFTNNVAEAAFFAVARGGAVATEIATISRCVFIGNTARHTNPDGPGFGGAVVSFSSADVIENCTMVGNSGSFTNGVGGFFALAGGNTIRSSIIANSIGRACGGAAGTTWSCCDLFGNSDDSLCGIDGGGNFNADPQFCDSDPLASLNVSIQEDSPCAPGKHPNGAACGLIGAAPVGCGPVGVESKTWSAVKNLYRE